MAESGNKNDMRDLYKYSGLAFQLFVFLILAYFAGSWLDKKFELEKPLLTALCMLLALIVYLYLIVRDTGR
jgi:membrane protein DedA with SNARE-associated domain